MEAAPTNSKIPDSMNALRELHHPDTARTRALLVDDCPRMRGLMRIVLGKALPDLEIIEAEHPMEALETLSMDGIADSIAFTLSDKDMPEMNGVEFAAVMNGQEVKGRSLHPNHVNSMRGVPRLMMTGTYDSALAQRLIEDGLFHHVGEKSGVITEVFKNIHKAIEKAASLKMQESAAQ